MNIKYTLTIGLNDKEDKVQKIATSDAYQMVKDIIPDDKTMYLVEGNYTHENGDRVTEKSIRVELFYFDDDKATDKVKAYVAEIKKALNQESILVEWQTPQSDLW